MHHVTIIQTSSAHHLQIINTSPINDPKDIEQYIARPSRCVCPVAIVAPCLLVRPVGRAFVCRSVPLSHSSSSVGPSRRIRTLVAGVVLCPSVRPLLWPVVVRPLFVCPVVRVVLCSFVPSFVRRGLSLTWTPVNTVLKSFYRMFVGSAPALKLNKICGRTNRSIHRGSSGSDFHATSKRWNRVTI